MMKAAVYYGPNDIRIEQIKRPEAGAEGVVVKVRACGVCPIIDLASWERPDTHGIGLARGHEWSGEIVEVGSKVTDFQVGDRVYMEPVFRPCYRCEACLQKDYWRCSNWMEGAAINGAFAEYIHLPFVTKDNVIKLPETLNFRDLALVEPLGLGIGVAKKAKPDDVVVVLGQHIVGLGITAFLKKMGVGKVITTGVSKNHVEASKEVGADIALHAIDDDVVKVVMHETAYKGANVVMVTDVRPDAFLQAIGAVRRSGTVWLAGAYGVPFRLAGSLGAGPHFAVGADYHGPIEPPLSFDPSMLYMRTAWGTLGERIPRWQEAIALMESGAITAEKYVTHIFPLDRTMEAFDMATDFQECIEVMVEP